MTFDEALARCRELGGSDVLIAVLTAADGSFKREVDFEDDTWNILGYSARKGNKRAVNLDFGKLKNRELRVFAKLFLLYVSKQGDYGVSTYLNLFYGLCELDRTAVNKDPVDLVTEDFLTTQKRLEFERAPATAYNRCCALERFSDWLNDELHVLLSYKNSVRYEPCPRRRRPSADRVEIPASVIFKLLALNGRDDLPVIDRLFVALVALMVATAMRIGEVLSPPADCLIREGEMLKIRYYPEKGGEQGTRTILSGYKDAVCQAVEMITEITEPGREIARRRRGNTYLDRGAVVQDEVAARYFFRLECHRWTADPLHDLKNSAGAWLETQKRHVDIFEALRRVNGVKTRAAIDIGTHDEKINDLIRDQEAINAGRVPERFQKRLKLWNHDSRVVTTSRIFRRLGMVHITSYEGYKILYEIAKQIVSDAQTFQFAGQVYPAPEYDAELEKRFSVSNRPVVEKQTKNFDLSPEDALFILPKYILSPSKKTSTSEYQLIDDGIFSRWLTGETSVFKRHDIRDPETGDLPSFSSTDIRAWKITQLGRGGVSELVSASYLNKKPGGNRPYDRREPLESTRELRRLLREHNLAGQVATTYEALSVVDQARADAYLGASTTLVKDLGYGYCLHNWNAWACPHDADCFVSTQGPGCCTHFLFNRKDPAQIRALESELDNEKDFYSKLKSGNVQYAYTGAKIENLENLLSKPERRR